MFWGAISLLSTVVSVLLSSAAVQQLTTGATSVQQGPSRQTISQSAVIGSTGVTKARAANAGRNAASRTPQSTGDSKSGSPNASLSANAGLRNAGQPASAVRGEDLGACCYGPIADPGYEPYQCIGDMLQADCLGLSEYTNWTGGGSCDDPGFLCPGAPTCCDASGGCDEYIERVQVGEIDNSSGCDQYQDYTALWTAVVPGMQYPITVTNGTPYAADICSIWVDWNQDKTFEDAGDEWIGDAVGGGVSPPYSFTLTVPTEGFVPGYARMRIRIDYSNPDPDPCGTTTYGEVEDYRLLVSDSSVVGACCDRHTYVDPANPWLGGVCVDDVPATDCVASGGQFTYQQQCAELEPVCGNPGACCHDFECYCVEVLEADCSEGRFAPGAPCYPDPFTPCCGCWMCGGGGMLYAPSEPDNPAFRSAVYALLNAPVDYFDAHSGTPTLEQLSMYNAVFTWVNYAYADPVAMGNVLADYVDQGGTVILGQWCRHSDQTNWLQGRIMDDPAYCPVLACTTSFGSGDYNMDGVLCAHVGSFGVVGAHGTSFLDVVSSVAPGAVTDGTIAAGSSTSVDAAWNSTKNVFYSPGNLGGEPCCTSGDWATLVANMTMCTPTSGACCDRETYADPSAPWAGGVCVDDSEALPCITAAHQYWPNQTCDSLDPVCGNPGACCDDATGACEITLQALCDEGRFRGGAACEDLPTPCGQWQPSGLLYAPTSPDNAAFRAAVSALLGGEPVDYFDARVSTPTLSQLSNYDAVLTWVDYPYADNVAMGDVLADFVDTGGRVILGQWCLPTASNYLAGRIMTPDYCPASISECTPGPYSPGQMCPYCSLSAMYVDPIAPQPGALSDGTFGTCPALVFWPDRSVFYSPGNTGGSFSGGGWDMLTANIVVCSSPPPFGACCNVLTGECFDGSSTMECIEHGPEWRWHLEGCADLQPPCGNPGACCDTHTGECTDDVLEANCEDQFHGGQQCAELDPPCGGWLGCCCDDFAGMLTSGLEANCAGRWQEATFCGDLDEDGVVGLSDYNMFRDTFGLCTGQPGYVAAADLDHDGCITLVDFQIWRLCYQYSGCLPEMFDPPCGMLQISFDLSVGFAAPPATLCGQDMTPFPLDTRPIIQDETEIPTPCPVPGAITCAPALSHRRIGSGWETWSHGYTGDVYYSNAATHITMTMPAGTTAVYFYVEPNPYSEETFQVLVNGQILSDAFVADGSGGAAYCGVCATASGPIETIELTCTSGADFAIGEFGIACQDVQGACCDEWAGECTDDVMASLCSETPHARFAPYGTCDELSPLCGEVQGACCYGQECVYQRPAVCDAGGGSYAGDGVACDPNPCLSADFHLDAPGNSTGTTCGAGNNSIGGNLAVPVSKRQSEVKKTR